MCVAAHAQIRSLLSLANHDRLQHDTTSGIGTPDRVGETHMKKNDHTSKTWADSTYTAEPTSARDIPPMQQIGRTATRRYRDTCRRPRPAKMKTLKLRSSAGSWRELVPLHAVSPSASDVV